MTPSNLPNTSALLIPWTFTINDIQDEKKKGGWNANIILEDKFTFHSQHRNLIKLLWCYGYLIMLEAEQEFNIVPHTERIWWCFILNGSLKVHCSRWYMEYAAFKKHFRELWITSTVFHLYERESTLIIHLSWLSILSSWITGFGIFIPLRIVALLMLLQNRHFMQSLHRKLRHEFSDSLF